jgi:hypothetical protein
VATKVLVVFYSKHGHVETLATAVGRGAESVRKTEVRVRRVPEVGDARCVGPQDRADHHHPTPGRRALIRERERVSGRDRQLSLTNLSDTESMQ